MASLQRSARGAQTDTKVGASGFQALDKIGPDAKSAQYVFWRREAALVVEATDFYRIWRRDVLAPSY